MLNIALIILLFLASAYLVLLIRSFEYMSVRELKRQARRGNLKAARVYSVRGVYGLQLWILLWVLLGLSTTGVVLMIEHLTVAWLALLINVPLLVLVHVVLPWSTRPKPSLALASTASPVLDIILRAIKPVLSLVTRSIGRWIDPEPIGTVHSKEELLEILQHTVGTDLVSKDEIRIAASALTFGDQAIGSVMTPFSVTKTISESEVLSPIVLDELHDSGFSRFPVTDKENQIVGILYFRDAVNAGASPKVKDVMVGEVNYLNEADMLDRALKAFLKTQHHLFIVVNEYEDMVGVISIEDVIERIIGMDIVDEFDQYSDLRAIAAKLAHERHEERQETLEESEHSEE